MTYNSNHMEGSKPSEVARDMRALLERYNAKDNVTIDDIIEFHAEFEYIHSFQDGNGRVGRLIALKECLKNNVIPFIIEDSKKSFYYRGLSEWRDKMTFRRCFKIVTVILVVLSAICIVIFQMKQTIFWFSSALALVTTTYHFVMRLVVGTLIDLLVRRGINYNNYWFKEKKFERKLYNMLHVKQWKHIIPTWEPEKFSTKQNKIEKIIENMCAAELIHEIIIIMGYASLLFSLFTPDWKKYLWIFVITAFLAGCCDIFFVILQRYNRPRVLKILRNHK
ncbi:Fic family protein [Eubacterium sp. MSJ-21]|nr:Fic family protein [Eubacterium sp. MSJ-21]